MTIPLWGRAWPVRNGEEKRLFKEVESFGYKRWRAARRNNRLLSVLVGALTGAVLCLSAALSSAVPSMRLVPVFYPVQSDGTADPPKAINALAADMSEQSIRSTALQLVNACEGYMYAGAPDRYVLCSMMLQGHVKQAYQARWFLPNGQPNKESNPQALYPHGQIDIVKISIEVKGHVAWVRFLRVVALDIDIPVNRATCKDPVCTTWTAIIDFQPAAKMSQEVRDQVQSGLVAVSYQLVEGKV